MITEVRRTRGPRVCQGDILRDIEHIANIHDSDGDLTITKISYPLVIVLTQDCDLEQDHRFRREKKNTQDKFMHSVLVAPLYNYEHFIAGDHLTRLTLKMRVFKPNATEGKTLQQNETPRYHYLDFGPDVPIATSVIDFKHYFSVNLKYIKRMKKTHFVRRVADLFREDISLRFAGFLSRIGLPDPPKTTQASTP
jgi:hypothetical protein